MPRLFPRRLAFILPAAIAISASAIARAQLNIVVPPEYESTEAPDGQASFATGFGDGYRLMGVIDASFFASLPTTHRTMTGWYMRPDGVLGNSNSVSWPNLKVTMSTTSATAGMMSNEFDENVAPDATVVYDGPIAFTTANLGPTGGPREFDIAFEFETPFHYDPSAGNLLMDWDVGGPAGWVGDDRVDVDPRFQWISNTSRHSPVANAVDTGTAVMSFAFGPTLTADFDGSGSVDADDLPVWESAFAATGDADANGDGVSDGHDFLLWQRQYGMSDFPAADGNGDDTVATADPALWTENFGRTTARTATHVVPEPAAAVLLLSSSIALQLVRWQRGFLLLNQSDSQFVSRFNTSAIARSK